MTLALHLLHLQHCSCLRDSAPLCFSLSPSKANSWGGGVLPLVARARGILRGGGAAMASLAGQDKRILFVRHGVTEMNIFLGSSHYGSPGFQDPGLWDTRLDARGVSQAEALNSRLLKGAATWATDKDAPIDLIVSSPLSRALHTASLAFEGERLRQVPRAVHAGLRERMWLSSDVGASPDELTAAWSGKGWDFSGLENKWWYTDESWQPGDDDWRKKGDYLHPGEPEQPFVQRLTDFKAWLLARPERRIACVAHWGTIYGLTGKSLENCETLELGLNEFKDLDIYVTD